MMLQMSKDDELAHPDDLGRRIASRRCTFGHKHGTAWGVFDVLQCAFIRRQSGRIFGAWLKRTERQNFNNATEGREPRPRAPLRVRPLTLAHFRVEPTIYSGFFRPASCRRAGSADQKEVALLHVR